VIRDHQRDDFVGASGELVLVAAHPGVFVAPFALVVADFGVRQREIVLHQPQLRGLERGDVVETFARLIAAGADEGILTHRLDLHELHRRNRRRQRGAGQALRLQVYETMS